MNLIKFDYEKFIIKNKISILLLVFIFSYLLRFIAFFIFSKQIYLPDSNNYIVEAVRLLANDVDNKIDLFSVTMPAYSLLMCIPTILEIFLSSNINFDNLNSIMSVNHYDNIYIFSIKDKAFLIDNIFSSLIPIIIFYLTLKIYQNHVVSIFSALLTSIYPVSIFYSISILTENFHIFFVLLGILLFFNEKYIYSYLIFVLSILIRPTFELLYPCIIFIHFFIFFRHKLFSNIIIYFFIYVIFMTPWWIFNYNKYDTFVRLHPNIGFMLYSGNNELNKTGGGIINKDFKIDNLQFRRLHEPIILDRELKDKAIKYIVNNKYIFVKNTIIKFKRLYSFKLFTNKYSGSLLGYIYTTSYLALFTLFIFSFIFIPKKSYKYLYIFVLFGLYLTLVHSLTISSVRYRYPIEIFMIIFSSYTFTMFFKKIFYK